ncbi:hypothetical protein HMPREF9225_1664 [Peptoniphilus duerdenii ATCC BAA-1640]|uniref:Uncharacterized protein n=1 Tax=Peptoniphilus duerdenii ATCC BAA-1640 TaxID=862517 RepID=E0NNC5_9FIRM|nr:hypothetical protein [Peptoniphilus duerdenii]EFM24798.1 hypothetical protein HMPREF9225_1664 [Peptoniphilus duerdenii ATCC BAA-1640]
MKELYILYDVKSRVVLYSTYSEEKIYAKAGELVESKTFRGEVHIIMINLAGVEK